MVLVLGACSSDSDSDDASVPVGTPTSFATPDDVGLTTTRTSSDESLSLSTLSSRASMATGGDVLVRVTGPEGSTPELQLNGADVTDQLAPRTDEAEGSVVLEGLVGGLVDGDNELRASTGDASVDLTVTNHPESGPIFSGPHLEPWGCETEAAGLGPSTDANCTTDPVTTWSYVDTTGALRPLEVPGGLPADAATTEVDGATWPFVVRTDKSVVNRGIATIWTLDPGAVEFPAELAAEGETPTWQAGAFNGRLVYRFGGGCGTQFTQGAALSGLGNGPDLSLLAKGYALATNSLNTFQTSCNAVLSAETMMMTRERFVKRYALPRFTIGDGGSGGAIQQLAIASAYPGALDGISASLPYPDSLSIAPNVTDCGLLLNYYETPTGSNLTDEQRLAISGHVSNGTCQNWSDLFLSAIDPTVGCGPQLADQVYDPTSRPTGVRCTLQDINVNLLGVDPETGFAARPLDNVGVEYGLAALEAGELSVDEFLDLNEDIGGFDIDGRIVPERTAASPASLERTYAIGALSGGAGLEDLPIILRNVYLDPDGDIHTRAWAFTVRERLKGANGGDPDNLLLWTDPGTGGLGTLVASITGQISGANLAVETIDAWLTAGSRPTNATNRCVLPDGEVLTGGWELYDQPGPCLDAYPVASEPRFVAGQGRRSDILACQRVPADAARYDVTFSDAQAARLASVFPEGVCDWTVPGIGQQAASGTWLDFGR